MTEQSSTTDLAAEMTMERTRPAAADELSGMELDAGQLADLVGEGGECVLAWTTRDGAPVGVVMAYVYRHGSFWTTCHERRARVAALRARPQSAIVLNRSGRSATFRGESIVHAAGEEGWERARTWFFPALAGTEREPDSPAARRALEFMDSPGQVVIETRAAPVVSFDFARFVARTLDGRP